jgi:hypothetical protein
MRETIPELIRDGVVFVLFYALVTWVFVKDDERRRTERLREERRQRLAAMGIDYKPRRKK